MDFNFGQPKSNMKRSSLVLICLALAFSAFLIIFGAGKVQAADKITPISTVKDLDDIRHDLKGHYVLQNDINLDVAPYNTGVGWVPIGDRNNRFTGTFDGNGKTISGLMIDNNHSNGLFRYADKDSKFLNVTLKDVDITGRTVVNSGALIGEIHSGGLIENVHVTGKISGGGYIGGIVGSLVNAKIKNSSADVTVSGGGTYVGGLVGRAGGDSAIIENSTSAGTVSSTSNRGSDIGGLAGVASNIINSSSSANVNSSSNTVRSNVGGLVGRIYSTITGQITDSSATGHVSAPNGENVGGLVGYMNAYTNGPITNSYATGTVTGLNHVGGLVGNNRGSSISDSYADGEVSGVDNVGGLIGHHHVDRAIVQKSYSESTVIATGDNVGGLVGATKDAPKIIDTYARGNVSGKDNVGGLVGFNPAATIHRSYATGKVSGQDKLGGLVGSDVHGKFSTNAPNFYDKQTTGMTDSVGATGDTTANMKTRSTFKGWNFTSTWRLNKGDYPTFRDKPFDKLTDVGSSYWGRDDITEIVEKEIMRGSPDPIDPTKSVFKPAANITRAEFAIVIVNALGETATSASTGFADHGQIPAWALKEVAKAKELGIVEGDDSGRFNPSSQISRAEIATMIARAYDLEASQGGDLGFADGSTIPSWARIHIAAVVESEIMQGQDGNRFAPAAQAQRVEAGVAALRAFNKYTE